MGDFFVYILKSSVCLAFFYLFYRLLLSRETFHRFNRIALLGLILFSVAIPFIRMITEEPVAIQRPIQNLEYLLQMAQMQTDMEMPAEQSFWLPLLFFVYLLGCIFFFFRFLYSTFRICYIIRQGERQQLHEGCKLVITSQPVSPFSWMGYIVISKKDMEESGREILIHELAHIHAYHSIDMLICSLCVVFQWFNPAAWLMKQELQNIHEYQADETVIGQGVDARNYQLLLIKKAVGSQRFTSMANSFNHSKLKKRITMMLKRKSSPWARLKYLYVLPLTAVAVVAFARPEISRELEKISSAKISEIVPVKEEVTPKKAEQVDEVVPPPAKESAATPAPRSAKVVAKKDTSTTKKENAAKATARSTAFQPTASILDSMEKQLDDFSKEAAESRQRVQQDMAALTGNEAITSEQEDTKDDKSVRGIGSGSLSSGKLPGGVMLRTRSSRGAQVDPLVIIDGVEQIEKNALEKLNPEIIQSISIMKDESSTKMYGDRAKGGVIIITTKNAALKKK